MAKAKTKAEKDKELANGAANIKKAEAEQVTVTKAELESKRPMMDVVKDRVRRLDGDLGIKIVDDTTLAESLQILDWTTQLADHVGFFVGDALNFGRSKWGDKYTAALNVTGRALPTLKGYASVSARIPITQRVAALSYTHHREIVRLGDEEKIATVLKEVGAEAKKGNVPTTREVSAKVKKLTPKSKPTSGKKGKKKTSKPEPPPYEPTDDENAQLDVAEEALAEAKAAFKTAFKIITKCSNKEKNRWLDILHAFVIFHKNLEDVTGYN